MAAWSSRHKQLERAYNTQACVATSPVLCVALHTIQELLPHVGLGQYTETKKAFFIGYMVHR